MFFQEELKKTIESDKFNAENLIGGDYNCAMDTTLDRFNCISTNNDGGQKELHDFIKSW